MTYTPMTPPLTPTQRTSAHPLTLMAALTERQGNAHADAQTPSPARSRPAYAQMQDDIADLIASLPPHTAAAIQAETTCEMEQALSTLTEALSARG